jgi:hypothetical protein
LAYRHKRIWHSKAFESRAVGAVWRAVSSCRPTHGADLEIHRPQVKVLYHPPRLAMREDTMFGSARAFAVAVVISATACGIANTTPIAPLVASVQTRPNNITQVQWYGYHHRHYWFPHRYWGTYPYRYYWGWHPCLKYWWSWPCGGGWW